jgi:sugar fermentation stimulation protein A
MRYETPLLPARFLKREKRFSVLAEIITQEGNREIWAHCPNPGRLTSCLDSCGIPLYLSTIPVNPKNPGGYRFRTEQSEPLPGIRVGINPNRANGLALEWLLDPSCPYLRGFGHAGSEIPYGEKSRIDHLFQSRRSGQKCFVEVKSVTYREGERALFPDAVSLRAIRHLHELSHRVREGDRACLLFVVQRVDCQVVGPADRVHPEYGESLRLAVKNGVEVRAVRFSPVKEGFIFGGEVPVIL